LALLLALTLLASVGTGLSVAAAAHPASAAPNGLVAPLATPARAPGPAATHGDLVVGPANSPFVISPATSGGSVYAEEGNITVQAGGTLVVRDETIDFVQFVANTGTLSQRLSHLYTFKVQGTALFENATVTTDASVLNAYTKLTFNISSGADVTLANSAFAFPGWLEVYGTGTQVHVNASQILGNPGVPHAIENLSLIGDNLWAPTLSVGGGARLTLANSSLEQTYKDNTSAFGLPGPAALVSLASYALTSSQSFSIGSWPMATNSENVTRGMAYSTFAGATVALYYATNTTQSSTGSTFTFQGTPYTLGPIPFNRGTGLALAPIPAAAVAAINAAGPIGWMEATGSFDQAGAISLHLGATNSANAVNVSYSSISLTPVLNYNVTVTGAGSTLTAVDSSLDLNWNLTPGTPVSPGTTYPTSWGSNKLLIDNGAVANLASVTIAHPRVGLFWNDSAVLPDAVSTANFYRWAVLPIQAGSAQPIPGAQVTAFYSYDASQLNNQTATTLNNLPTADPDLAAYTNFFDVSHGIAGYGKSGADGNAWLLLASSTLTGATLPVGTFIGSYHVAVNLAGGGSGSSQWGYAAVAPYPSEMTPALPDQQTSYVFHNYAPELSIESASVLVAGVPVTGAAVAIGEPLTVQATLTNTGTGPLTESQVNLSYVLPTPFAPERVAPSLAFGPLAAGASETANFTWVVNESVLGTHGTYTASFVLLADWNGGLAPTGGVVAFPINVTIDPAPIRLYFTLAQPGATLTPGNEYEGNGSAVFNGSGNARINITAVGPNGDRFLLSTVSTPTGNFSAVFIPFTTMGPGTYAITTTASYNGRTVSYSSANAFTIAATAGPTPSLLAQKFFGLPFMDWLLVIIVAIVGVVAFLLLTRSAARGKLVECGECGALIPDHAMVCPQCGAEFETDLVRCSRCGSTIPANSTVCPECAAQLLGKPEEETRDPERQGYNDLVDRFKTESKRELGDNYSEGAFWDWWKRQPSYLSFSQWRLQQAQGSRAGMTAPPANASEVLSAAVSPNPPKKGGGAAPPAAARPAARTAATPAAAPRSAAPPAAASAAAATSATVPSFDEVPATTPSAGMKACSNCGKEIPPEYLVCPFCGAVTQ
jgi:RNA polymerase subunit RPABC4/transcription elongation factor Spt4